MQNMLNFMRVYPSIIVRRFISTLYVTGDKAKESYAVLVPYFDFNEKIGDPKFMKEILKLRNSNLDLDLICQAYKEYQICEKQKLLIESRREIIANELKSVKSISDKNVEELKREAILLREELKDLKQKSYDIEGKFIYQFLSLPNKLHVKTPKYKSEVIYQYRNDNEKEMNSVNHLSCVDLIDYRNKFCYYLKESAAEFELSFPINILKYFTNEDFIEFVNPDFSRRILLEAALLHDSMYMQIDENGNDSNKNTLHLTGGGSLLSYLGYIGKLSIYPKTLPLKFITAGRHYISKSPVSDMGLFTVYQSKTINAMIVTETSIQADEKFETLLNQIVEVYKRINLPFRVSILPAHELLPAECLHASIQIYSSVFKEFIEVGNLSNYSDFISKRLLFNIKDGKEYIFPHIISGTICNITKLIACILERHKSLNPIF